MLLTNSLAINQVSQIQVFIPFQDLETTFMIRLQLGWIESSTKISWKAFLGYLQRVEQIYFVRPEESSFRNVACVYCNSWSYQNYYAFKE